MEDKAPGFRFYPTEEELLLFYLHNKLHDKRQDLHRVIPVLNIFQLDPWHLPQNAGQLCNQDPEQWFFFAPRQHREACGGRPNRITSSGYWKATGSPCYVYSSESKVIGLKKTMVFYKGKAPTGRKTKWKLNEYRAIEGDSATPKLRHEFSLCRVYISSGCLRAFDRRPSGTLVNQTPIHEQEANQVIVTQTPIHEQEANQVIVTQTPIHEQQANQVMVASTTCKSSQEDAAEKPSSTDSSSLGEDAQNLPLAEADGDHLKMMTNDPYPLWELEQLNWLFGQQSGTDPVADELKEVSLKKLT